MGLFVSTTFYIKYEGNKKYIKNPTTCRCISSKDPNNTTIKIHKKFIIKSQVANSFDSLKTLLKSNGV